MIELPRRRFLAGLVGLIAAPAIVKAASLMPVKAFPPHKPWRSINRIVRETIDLEQMRNRNVLLTLNEEDGSLWFRNVPIRLVDEIAA